jgi:hypothetical protein
MDLVGAEPCAGGEGHGSWRLVAGLYRESPYAIRPIATGGPIVKGQNVVNPPDELARHRMARAHRRLIRERGRPQDG